MFKRILFLVLWAVLAIPPVYADIEIDVNGQQYSSFQAYEDAKKAGNLKAAVPGPVLNSPQIEYIRQQAKELGIKVDFDKVKTLQLDSKHMTEADLHSIYVLGVEKGFVDALHDFYQRQGVDVDMSTGGILSIDQIQEAIQKAVTTSQYPKLLISEPGKLRIMALTTDEPHK